MDVMIRPATLLDLAFIDALRANAWEAVGFIPMSRYEAQVQRGTGLLVVEANGQLGGFVFYAHGFPLTSIYQIVVVEDARRLHYGHLLVQAVKAESRSRGRLGIRCRVGQDLESNAFWQAIGFNCAGVAKGQYLWKPPRASARTLNRYEQLWTPRLID